MKQDNHTAIRHIKETFPKIVNYTNSWFSLAKIHGYEQSEQEKKTIIKFSKAMKQLTKGKTIR